MALFEGLIFGGTYIRRGLSMDEGNLRFKIDWASLTVGRKFTVLLCFTLHLRAISKYKPPLPPRRGANIWSADLTDSFLHCEFGGLIFGGAYFRNFTVCNNEDVYSHDKG